MEPLDQEIAEALAERRPKRGPARILVAAPKTVCHDEALRHLRKRRHRCVRVESLHDANAALERDRFELVLVAPTLADGNGFDLPAAVQRVCPAAKIIVISPENCVKAAVDAMRCGAIDFISVPVEYQELLDRVEAALLKSRIDQQREERLTRLQNICSQLNTARHEITEQLDLLCHDLVCAYREMSEQVNEVAMASEFRTLLRQELDVEDLLRTTLEYLLTKTGPTNAAVFLPDGDEYFTLGAYVNYDCPRDTIASVLDRVGEAVCPQMATEEDIIRFDDAREFAKWINMNSGMLSESQVIAFSCVHEDECLAVIVLFRNASRPFDATLAQTIDILRPIFAEQLTNVVEVHHRAQPEWPADAHEACEDDVYDEDDFGFGGLAA